MKKFVNWLMKSLRNGETNLYVGWRSVSRSWKQTTPKSVIVTVEWFHVFILSCLLNKSSRRFRFSFCNEVNDLANKLRVGMHVITSALLNWVKGTDERFCMNYLAHYVSFRILLLGQCRVTKNSFVFLTAAKPSVSDGSIFRLLMWV